MTLRGVIPGLLSVAALGCSGSPTQPSWDGRARVAGTVQDFPTSGAASAATVVFGTGGASDARATTDANGVYALTVLPGMYHVTINGESIADVTLRDPTYRGDFFIRATNCIGRYGMILDSRTRQPVSGATVSLGQRPSPLRRRTQRDGININRRLDAVAYADSYYPLFLSYHPGYAQKFIDSGRGFCKVYRIDVDLDRNSVQPLARVAPTKGTRQMPELASLRSNSASVCHNC